LGWLCPNTHGTKLCEWIIITTQLCCGPICIEGSFEHHPDLTKRMTRLCLPIILSLVWISKAYCQSTTGDGGGEGGSGEDGVLTQADKSCADFGILKGEGLEIGCQQHCLADNFEVFDWAASRSSDPNIVDRNTWCRCLDPLFGNTTFECSDIEEEVWNLATPLKVCDALNVTSGTTCEEYCKSNIDPKAFEFKGSGPTLQCFCGSNPQLHICGTVSGAMMVASEWLWSVGRSVTVAIMVSVSLW
jgi:hypothetical protein